jgi:hypothetical protein
MGTQKTANSQSNTGDITIPDFELYYRAIGTKITWHWHKNSKTMVQNRGPGYESMQLSSLNI